MSYVDGYVLVVPKENRAKYKKMAKEGAAIWKKHGAIDYKECRIDDATPPWITATFPKVTKAKEGEEVWFSFAVFKSKADRTRINKLVMKYFEEKYSEEDMKNMPFDMKRMSFGGFTVEVEM